MRDQRPLDAAAARLREHAAAAEPGDATVGLRRGDGHDATVELGQDLVVAVGPRDQRLERPPCLGDRRLDVERGDVRLDPRSLVGGPVHRPDDQSRHGGRRRGKKLLDRGGVDADATIRHGTGSARFLAGVDEPARGPGGAIEVEDLVGRDRNHPQAECAVELGSREVRRGNGRQVAVVDDPDVVARLRRGAPHREPGLAIDVVEELEQVEDRRGRFVRRRRHRDRVAGADLALDDDPGVHPRVGRVGEDRDAAGLAVPERALDDVARPGGGRELEDEAVPDRESRPDRQPGQLEAGRRQVLPDRAGLDRVAVGLDPLDRLDAEQRHRAVRPAVDVPMLVGVAVEAHRADPRPIDGVLRHAARGDVDLEHATVHRSRC